MFSNMPIMLSRFTPGVAPAEAEVQNIFQGYMEGTTAPPGGQVGTGSGFDSRNTGNLYTIDGAMNNGFGRRIASSPNADQIEEVRIETSNFDASQGHGTGLTVSMMTRSGTNTLRGSGNYTHWNNQLNSPSLQQKVDVQARTRARKTRGVRAARTSPHSRSAARSSSPRSSTGAASCSSSPTTRSRTTRRPDASPAPPPCLPTGSTSRAISPTCCCCRRAPGPPRPPGHHQYQIFDPLTTRPDPLRPGRVIRDPFPGNIIPKDRFMNPDGTYKNPAFGLYQAMVPAPNQNFLSPTQQPVNNYYRAAEPDQPHNTQGSVRIDYNHSESSRFFVRANGNKFLESSLVDWTYDSPDPQFRGPARRGACPVQLVGDRHVDEGAEQHDAASTRRFPATAPISGTRARTWSTTGRSSVGLPAYLDEFCEARFECILPQQNIGPLPSAPTRAWAARSTAGSG